MSFLSDKFQVLLPSKAKSNPINKPNLYETELAKQLDLPGEWDVDFINISYLNNWTNLDKSYQYFLLRQPIEDVNSEFPFEYKYDQTDLFNLIS